MQLINPSRDMAQAFITTAKDYQAHGEQAHHEVLDPAADFSQYVKDLEEDEQGINLRPGRVAERTFWLVDDRRETIFGISRLRPNLAPRLERVGGNIGYEVPPAQRGQGYGTLLLGLTLQKAKEIGLTRVLITCSRSNIASAKIILHNGGILRDEIIAEDDGRIVQRYWVDLL